MKVIWHNNFKKEKIDSVLHKISIKVVPVLTYFKMCVYRERERLGKPQKSIC